MTIETLLKGLNVLAHRGPLKQAVSGIAYDSRKVSPGYLFVALRGLKTDGHGYVQDALDRGAVGIVSEDEGRGASAPNPGKETVARIVVSDSRKALAHLSSRFYGDPVQRLKLVGVTGTNGKTTTCYLIHSILEAEGVPAGLLGTVRYRIGSMTLPVSHTTPESLELHGLFSKMVENGLTAAVMEVSSHALILERVWGCPFEVTVFTNLTQDHLDFHGTFENYFQAKAALFRDHHRKRGGGETAGTAVLNRDDPWTERLRGETSRQIVTYGIDGPADIRAKEIRMDYHGISLLADTPKGVFPVSSKLVGRHNVYNLLAAAGAGIAMGCSVKSIQQGIQAVGHVPGRFEKVEEGQGYGAVVDYAHTEDALFRVLCSAASLTPGRLITVFGCGGDRDKLKRPKMGSVAAQWSDLVILTSDNPRSEDPGRILKDVEEGLTGARGESRRMQQYWVVPDRKKAIQKAVGLARPGDLVVIAGKGHEDYQIVGEERLPFDDREEVRKAIRAQSQVSNRAG